MASIKTATLLVVILASVAISASSPIDSTEDQGNELRSFTEGAYGKRLPGDKQIYDGYVREGNGSQGYYETNRIYTAPEGHVINYVRFRGKHGTGEAVYENGYGIGARQFWMFFRSTESHMIDMHVEVYAIDKSELSLKN